jgi:hypothetical protein
VGGGVGAAQVSGNLGLTVIPFKSEVPYVSVKCILFNPRTCMCKVTRLENDGSSKVLVHIGPGPKNAVDGEMNSTVRIKFPFKLLVRMKEKPWIGF